MKKIYLSLLINAFLFNFLDLGIRAEIEFCGD